jgi:F0F1-type ATP synthase membrane subunit b/b'
MLPNPSILWVIFFLLVLTFVVDRLLLRPVLGVIRKREEAIESARELARASRAASGCGRRPRIHGSATDLLI